jgi:upstream activation factor subunit UAF30
MVGSRLTERDGWGSVISSSFPSGEPDTVLRRQVLARNHMETNRMTNTGKKTQATPAKAAPAAGKSSKAPEAKKAKAAGSAFAKPLQPSKELAAVVGSDPLPRTEVVSKVWHYIKKHKLQNEANKREILADDKLAAVFGKSKVTMFEMNKFLAQHLK